MMAENENVAEARPSMKPNPGGSTKDFRRDTVGRDDLAKNCFLTLQVKSVVLVSDRRMGKTWLLGKMGQEAAEDVIWLYIDTEYASSLGELLDRMYDAARDQLSLGTRAFARTTELIQAVGGKGFGSFTVPAFKGLWKKTLSAIVDDLCEHAEGRTVALVMDEFPLFLHKLIENDDDGAGRAMELCDVLRYFRQTHPPLRMVLAGSIGLHLVMDDLRSRGYHNAPFSFDIACAAHPQVTRSRMAELAEMLERDHYARRHSDGDAYAFASNILRRWWLHRRKGVAGT